MLRVCGAEKQASPIARRQCWCRGVFCGPGGGVLTKRFRAAFHTTKTANSVEQYLDLVAQADLFDADQVRSEWIAKLGPRDVAPRKRKAAPTLDVGELPGSVTRV